jgi:hypothetical protein
MSAARAPLSSLVVQESGKAQTDRQLGELLPELRVVLPGAQVLLGFLFAVPFATRFARTDAVERLALLIALIASVAGTLLLMAPSVYHRVRWRQGGKRDVVLMAHRFFVGGSALLAFSVDAAVFTVSDFLYGQSVAIGCSVLVALLVVASWYALPLGRSREPRVRGEE